MQKKFETYILASVIIHVLVILSFWISPSWFIRPLEKQYKVTWLKLSKGDGGSSLKSSYKKSKNLPQSTIREQKKALKELSKSKKGSDLKTHESKTKKSVVQKWSNKKTAKSGGLNIKKKSGKKSRISDALARIDQQLDQREVDMSVAQANTTETGQSPWGSTTGTKTDPALIGYYNTIKRKINKEWVLAKGDFTGTLRTKIVVRIDGRGNVIKSQFKRTSGDGSFDASAMRAIKNSAPFPIPPQSIRREALAEGFLIEFNPNTVTGRI